MFRHSSGFKMQYQRLTLYVISELDEWRVFVQGPGLTIHGARQFSEGKAKEHARAIATSYLQDEKHEDLPDIETLEWQLVADGEWLTWRP